MAEQIRGVILEGLSCSGKTSLFNALKRYQAANKNNERSCIFLSETYSQNLNWVNGEYKTMSREENLRVLEDRLTMLEQLSAYADAMGKRSRRSRGLFFCFERFHLNFAACFPEGDRTALEERLNKVHAMTVVCMIGDEKIEERLRHRALSTGEDIADEMVKEYRESQQRFLSLAKASSTRVLLLNTDSMDWDSLAETVMNML